MKMMYFVIKDYDGDIYIEPHKVPARAVDVEVDGKTILDYALDRDRAEHRLRLLTEAAI